MKLALPIIVALMVSIAQGPTGSETSSDIIVLKFSWATYRPPSNVEILTKIIEGVPNANAATDPHTRPISRSNRREEPEEIMRERDIQRRSRNLREVEREAARNPRKPRETYIYHLQIKNTGKQLVRSLVWEYQSSILPGNSGPRQFFCRAKIKPNETKSFYVISPSPPARVIAATDIEEDQPNEKRVIVNRIEYDHGLVWQRTSWESEVLSKLGSLKVSGGRCASL